ncbi:hypothetical protein THIX_60178 [Thiomonas sp. X19]|nr:hypothetical protein THIX_60178 [Thiomonas sp. X19]
MATDMRCLGQQGRSGSSARALGCAAAIVSDSVFIRKTAKSDSLLGKQGQFTFDLGATEVGAEKTSGALVCGSIMIE